MAAEHTYDTHTVYGGRGEEEEEEEEKPAHQAWHPFGQEETLKLNTEKINLVSIEPGHTVIHSKDFLLFGFGRHGFGPCVQVCRFGLTTVFIEGWHALALRSGKTLHIGSL